MAIESNGTLLQAAYGGYLLVDPATEVKEEITTESYVEPGFTVAGPIEFAISKSDQFYFIIRKRADVFGTTFEDLSFSNLSAVITDATMGMSLEYDLQDFSSDSVFYDANWDDGLADNKKVILAVDCGTPIYSPNDRVRVIDCQITDNRDNSLMLFRILVDDVNKVFHYLEVKTNTLSQRKAFATAGSSVIQEVDGKGDAYVLISPFASFNETDKASSNFAYPLNTIFYQRQSTFNQEDFSYLIDSYTDDVLLENVRVKNVPGYAQMGVIIIDKNLYTDIDGIVREIYVDIDVRGLISEMRDTFRINFVRI